MFLTCPWLLCLKKMKRSRLGSCNQQVSVVFRENMESDGHLNIKGPRVNIRAFREIINLEY